MDQSKKPIWNPSNNENYLISNFINYVEEKHQIEINNYAELHRWSIDHSSEFWLTFSKFTNLGLNDDISKVHIEDEHIYESNWFVDSKLNYAQRLLSKRDESIAIIYRDEAGNKQEISYSDLNSQVGSFIQTLKKLGIQKGDVVAAIMTNSPEAIIGMLASSAIGAVWTSCSPDFGVDAILDRIGQVQPKILIAIDQYQYAGKKYSMVEKIHAIKSKLIDLKAVFIVEYENNIGDEYFFSDSIKFKSCLDKKIDPEFTPLPFNHPLFIMYSSGTTGKPKCIVHSAGGTLIQLIKEHQLHADIKPGEKVFFFTTCGWMMWNWLVTALASEATIILYEGSPFYPSKNHLWDIAEQEKIHHFGISPRYISALSKEGVIPKNDFKLNSLRAILSTGSPLLPDHYKFIRQSIKSGIQISSISGGTDIISCFALSVPILPIFEGEIQCAGLGMDIHIFSSNGIEADIGKKGELVCSKPFPSMPIYFFNDKNKKKYKKSYFEKYNNVWAHGDFACMTKNNGLIIFGRSDATLNSGGVRIGTAEIYRQLESFDRITESVVIERKRSHDSEIVLFIILRKDDSLDQNLIKEIKNQLKNNASPRHVPNKIIAVKDIPRTISGKISELAVKAAIEGNHIKNIEALANPESLIIFNNINQELNGQQ